MLIQGLAGAGCGSGWDLQAAYHQLLHPAEARLGTGHNVEGKKGFVRLRTRSRCIGSVPNARRSSWEAFGVHRHHEQHGPGGQALISPETPSTAAGN